MEKCLHCGKPTNSLLRINFKDTIRICKLCSAALVIASSNANNFSDVNGVVDFLLTLIANQQKQIEDLKYKKK